MSIHHFLSEARVPYTVLPHRPAFTAQQEAAATHVRGRDWAKAVVCIVDDKPIEAVLPAPYMVNLDDLLALTGGKKIRVAREEEVGRLFLDCEPGAMPPLGSIYGQMVYVDVKGAAQLISSRRVCDSSWCCCRAFNRGMLKHTSTAVHGPLPRLALPA
jgi:Ala-tRNA(Pro) deacylase